MTPTLDQLKRTVRDALLEYKRDAKNGVKMKDQEAPLLADFLVERIMELVSK